MKGDKEGENEAKTTDIKKLRFRQETEPLDCGARGETRTLTIVNRWILNPLRLPFRHPGISSCFSEERIMPYFFRLCKSQFLKGLKKAVEFVT